MHLNQQLKVFRIAINLKAGVLGQVGAKLCRTLGPIDTPELDAPQQQPTKYSI